MNMCTSSHAENVMLPSQSCVEVKLCCFFQYESLTIRWPSCGYTLEWMRIVEDRRKFGVYPYSTCKPSHSKGFLYL